MLKFFDADPGSKNLFNAGSGMKKIRIRDKLPSFTILLFLSVIFAFLILDSDPQVQLNPNRKTSVADPDPRSSAFLTPGSGIRDG